MIQIKSQNQMSFIDPWDQISPKRRKMLDASWSGLFQKTILRSFPVKEIANHFDKSMGRPTKELYTVIGVLVLQQAFDLTDIETVEQLAFNIQWHYALNITEESDTAKYMCPKTLWSMRKIVTENNLDQIIFNEGTGKLAEIFKVDPTNQRLDSTHIKSNMKRLGRICLFSETIHKFLVNLKKGHKEQFDNIDKEIVDRYLSQKSLECFSRVKPSDSHKSLKVVSRDLFDLVQQFKGHDEIKNMHSYKQLERVLKEQCNLTGNDDNPLNIKAPKEIPSDSLQNPSDPDATYSGHKGQGYQVQIMETFSSSKEKKELNLITHVEVEPAHKSDAHALIPAIESAKARDLLPQKVLADSLYGSDNNHESAKEHSVELIAPLMGAPKAEGISLSDFRFSDDGQITFCPQNKCPVQIREKKGKVTVCFNSQHCQLCAHLEKCPVKVGRKFYYLRYTDKDYRIAQRRVYEQTEKFKAQYRWRSGIEATMSEYKKRTGVGRLRVRGLDAVRFCTTLKAFAVNIFRASVFRIGKLLENQNTFPNKAIIFKMIYVVKERFFVFKQIFLIKLNQFNDFYDFQLVLWV